MTEPLISIVIPMYNATEHLEKGLGGIAAQTYKNWELIAVDDGSSDDTEKVFKDLTKDWSQKIKYVHRENGGGFAARNTGLDNVEGKYIALFDIDDLWYPHHLKDCLDVMEEVPDVDWLYAANKIIDLTQDGKVLQPSCFFVDGKPKQFLSLETKKIGKLNLITDDRVAAYQILYGLHAGEQFSLIRKEVFNDYRFRSDYRNEGADQVAMVRTHKAGFKMGYLMEIHGEYAVHENNASAGCKGASAEKYLRLRRAMIRGFKEAEGELYLKPFEVRAVNHRIAREYFWNIGYNIYLANKDYKNALKNFRQGLYYHPWNLKFWKTYFVTLLKQVLSK